MLSAGITTDGADGDDSSCTPVTDEPFLYS
jgi:hypothetical protein